MDSSKSVLVTGGAGYIGSHTAVELVNAGYEVILLDNFSNSDINAVEGVRKITGRHIPFELVDACEKKALRRIFEKYSFASVIHFAGHKAVGESVAEPLKYYQNNLVSFMNVVQLMEEFKRPNIIFSSSATVYGEAERLPVSEQSPRKASTSPYGNSKQINEDILRDCCQTGNGLHGISLRYFNPIGAHPSALIGEQPRDRPNNLVPFISQTAAGVRKELSVFGNDYPTADGTCLRDYIDICDLALAHVAAMSRMLSEKMAASYEIFNIGTGKPVSVLELIAAFEKVNRIKLAWKFAPRRAGDVTAIWADPSLANKELDWRAERGLEETLRSAWEWEKKLRGLC